MLNLTVTSYINPSEQYKQAYSLKALMWLRESFVGLEDAFKLTSKVMQCYAKVVSACKDASIEQYVLNQWTRDLSLRDICDRINATIVNECMPADLTFPPLLNWLSEVIQRNAETQIFLDDFRKIATFIAQGLSR